MLELKVPPHSVEAELSVLGGILLDSTKLNEINNIIKYQYFYLEKHQRIFRAMLECADHDIKIDILSLKEVLSQQNTLEEIGGVIYLAKILEGTPGAYDIEMHAGIVRDKAAKRQLINIGNKIQHEAYEENQPVSVLLDRFSEEIFTLSLNREAKESKSLSEVLAESIQDIEEAHKDPTSLQGIYTGYEEYDTLTNGLHPGTVVLIAGRPSSGKTTFALNIALNIVNQLNHAVGVISLEMNQKEIALKLLCMDSDNNTKYITAGSIKSGELSRLKRSYDELKNSRLIIEDNGMLTISDIKSKCRRMVQHHGVKLIIIDYIQLIHVSGKKGFNRHSEITEISGEIKALAKELQIPIMCLCQLNRMIEGRDDKTPQLSDLKESGSLEQDGDVVGFLIPEKMDETNKMVCFTKLYILKQRTGETGDMTLIFHKNTQRFRNIQLTEEYERDIEM